MNEVIILGTRINSTTSAELEKKIEKALDGGRLVMAKSNSEFLLRACRDILFQKVLNMCDENIPDGRGILWVAKYLTLPISSSKFFRPAQAIWQMVYSGAAIVINPKYITYPLTENIPGVEALKLMLEVANKSESKVFFFGATQSDLDASINNIKKEMPHLNIVGSLNGYDFQKNKTIDPVMVINKSKADMLIVALGSPFQEFWIQENIDKLSNVRVAVGEGGSLAFISGSQKRAPKWMQQLGLEWLWRLFTNRSLTHQTGSRLKRVWNAVPVFIYEVVKLKIRYGATEVK